MIDQLFHQDNIRASHEYQKQLIRDETRSMLLKFIRVESQRLRESSWSPKYLEYGFGSDVSGGNAFEVDFSGRKVSFKGFIDRIDVDASGKHMMIIDYKRSAGFKKKDLNSFI